MGVTAPVARRRLTPEPAEPATGSCAGCARLGDRRDHAGRPRLPARSTTPARRSTRSGSASSGHEAWAPNFKIFGAADMLYGTAVSSAMALRDRRAAGDRDRDLAGDDRAATRQRRGRPAGRDAGGGAEHHLRVLGRDRARAVHPEDRARAPQRARLHPAVRATRRPPGSACSPPAIVLTLMILPIVASLCRDLFLTVPTGAEGGRRGTRRDPLGGDPRDRAALDALGRQRRNGARPRPRARRGDRGLARDRRRQRDPRVRCSCPARRSPSGSPTSSRTGQPAPHGLDVLRGPAPARDLPADEPAGAARSRGGSTSSAATRAAAMA